MSEWRREIEAFLRSKWGKPVLCVGVVAALLGLAYQILIVLPERRAQQQRQVEWQSREWLLLREPVPQEDRGLEERHLAWDEIERKRIDPDYQIPPHKRELIQKHWAELTSGWTADQIDALKKRLGFSDANPTSEPSTPPKASPKGNGI